MVPLVPAIAFDMQRKGRAMVKWPGPNSRSVFEGHSWEVAARSQSAQRSIVPCRSQERSSWTTVQYPTMALI